MRSWNKIEEAVLKELDSINNLSILFQSGHFSLISNYEGNLVPAIHSSISDYKLKQFILDSNYMGDFPIRTFNSSMSIVRNINIVEKINFAFIVNDWQWLNKSIYKNTSNRTEFYKRNRLPDLYFEKFITNNINTEQIVYSNHYIGNNCFFSENKLRKNAKKLTSNCSPESCALEYYPFLEQNLSNYNCIVSYIPMSCKIPILFAAINYIINSNNDIKLIHIFYDPISKEKELSIINRALISYDLINEVTENYERMELMSL